MEGEGAEEMSHVFVYTVLDCVCLCLEASFGSDPEVVVHEPFEELVIIDLRIAFWVVLGHQCMELLIRDLHA